MHLFRLKLLGILLSISAVTQAQKLRKADKTIIANLEKHVGYLADDKLEGRRAGTHGEALAMDYISAQFRQMGLLPKGEDTYFQPFEIYDGKESGSAASFVINNKPLKLYKDYFPFPFSANATVVARPALALLEAGMPWFFNLKETLEENRDNPHFDLETFIRTETKEAHKKGATAIIFYNTSSTNDGLMYNAKDRSPAAPIPAVYINQEFVKDNFKDPYASLDVKLTVQLEEKTRTGHNVIGYINNHAPATIIIGAHYDHLGYGEDGNSLLRTGEHLIHNGADDNASGTAALIELARLLKKSKLKNNNYLFIAFSGEELGLFGSKYFTEHPTIDLSTVNCMINMDMVGRLNDSTNTITVGGYGTSPAWAEYIHAGQAGSPFQIKIDSSGTGPSDHTSFYRKDIPVLFFFTGLHPDYHRPTDDADKINYTGEYKIVKYIDNILTGLNHQKQKLVFTKTRETQTTTSARFSVTLGIMPDYTYAGSGVRCDGVSEGKPAQKAGLKTGDIIIQLGDITVTSLENYMQALGKFKKGDKTTVKYKRGNDTLQADVEF
jgi:hypothetical protein